MSPQKTGKKKPKKDLIPNESVSAVTKTRSALGEYERAGEAADFILAQTVLRPKIALVLGSGLGAFGDEFTSAAKIPYAKVPHFPQSTAIGHAGKLVTGKVGAIPVAGMQGRVHLYEGYSAKEVAFPIRVFARMGVKAVILTNAAGGIKREFSQGRLVVISDHINLQGVNPLTGPNDERFGLRFHDMTSAYDKRFREMTVGEANRLGIGMYEGVYAGLLGPEVIAARHSGIRVLGISCVTNAAAGILDQPLNHLEVLETAERVKGQFIGLLKAVIPRIAEAIA